MYVDSRDLTNSVSLAVVDSDAGGLPPQHSSLVNKPGGASHFSVSL